MCHHGETLDSDHGSNIEEFIAYSGARHGRNTG